MNVWWPIYPEDFRRVFTHAFTTGLHDPSLHGRVTEGIWRRALLRLNDSVWTCPRCQAAVLYDGEQSAQRCWDCQAALPVPPRLTFPATLSWPKGPSSHATTCTGTATTARWRRRWNRTRAAPRASCCGTCRRRHGWWYPTGKAQDRRTRSAAGGPADGHRLPGRARPDRAAGRRSGSPVAPGRVRR